MAEFVQTAIQHIDEPIPGIEFEYMLVQQMAPNIPVTAVNELMKQLVTDNNQVVLLAGPHLSAFNVFRDKRFVGNFVFVWFQIE